MKYMLRTLVLSAFFVSAVQASEYCDTLKEQASAIHLREYFKQQLNQGRMVNSSQVMMLREGVYLLKGNGYLPDEIYEVPSAVNDLDTSTVLPTSSAVFYFIVTCIALATVDEIIAANA